ncbi:nucleotidyl transferase AbiEii/AbiGii toxin family protein [Flavobacterium rivuli]|uniref:nucleotidyl transferase AbiEii/AbiGii toxin family protein n=1 Tax=Flavobacterium rivuli TaxID=498301 RepID=UPI001E3C16A4|nr:nucleotidyl transferase AbiEii/AbiGii toxin family protein [Flavobacterium rivuli]
MNSTEFDEFRLVGGTALSLQLGHRLSVDIDLFTDADYGSIDFKIIEDFLDANFGYVDKGFGTITGMGKSYLVGEDRENTVKLDLFYTTDPFMEPPLLIEEIRMATLDEIIAMKVDVVQRTGRKKDFYDLYDVLPRYSIKEMIALHKRRYQYSHDEALIREISKISLKPMMILILFACVVIIGILLKKTLLVQSTMNSSPTPRHSLKIKMPSKLVSLVNIKLLHSAKIFKRITFRKITKMYL